MNRVEQNPERTALGLMKKWVGKEGPYQFERVTPEQQAIRFRKSSLTSSGNIGPDIADRYNRFHLFRTDRPDAALQTIAKSVAGVRSIYVEVLKEQGMGWQRANLHSWGIVGPHRPELIYDSAVQDLSRANFDDTAPGKMLHLVAGQFATDVMAERTLHTARETYELAFGLAALAVADIWKETGEWLLPTGGVSSTEDITSYTQLG